MTNLTTRTVPPSLDLLGELKKREQTIKKNLEKEAHRVIMKGRSKSRIFAPFISVAGMLIPPCFFSDPPQKLLATLWIIWLCGGWIVTTVFLIHLEERLYLSRRYTDFHRLRDEFWLRITNFLERKKWSSHDHRSARIPALQEAQFFLEQTEMEQELRDVLEQIGPTDDENTRSQNFWYRTLPANTLAS